MATQPVKSFTSIPILSLASARDPETKQAFLEQLLDALLHVGFLYLSDTGVDPALVTKVCEQTRLFFDEDVLPQEEKLKIEMVHKPSFLGYSRVS
jgi:isopenicillin N synthase-like dioxygenase